MGLTKFQNYQILLNQINLRFLVTTKLFTGWKSLIDFQPRHLTNWLSIKWQMPYFIVLKRLKFHWWTDQLKSAFL